MSNNMSCVSSRDDENLTKEFYFEVNLNHESGNNDPNIASKVNTHLEINSNYVITTTDSEAMVIDELETKNKELPAKYYDPKITSEILKEKAIVLDDITTKETLITDHDPKSSSEDSSTTNDLDKAKAKDYPIVVDNKKQNIKDTVNIIDLDKLGTENILDLDKNKVNSDDVIVLDGSKRDSEGVIVLDGNKKDSEGVIVLDGNKKDSEDIMVLDGHKKDSEDVIVLDGNKTDSEGVIDLDGNKTDSESTIILDDDESNKLIKKTPKLDCIIIDDVEKGPLCINSNSTKPIKKRTEYNDLYKENELLTELIEKCLDMENTEGMIRVINRTLLGIYKSVDEEYKKSDAFKKTINKTIMHLDTEPHKKFSHLKNLCDKLKNHMVKKRVPFITLTDKTDTEQSTSCIPAKRRRVDMVIDLDDDIIIDVPEQNNTIVNHRKQIRPIEVVYPPIEINDDDSSSDDLINDGNNDTSHHNSNKENSKKYHLYKKQKKHKRKSRPKNIDLSNSDKNQNDALSGIVISQIMSCADLNVNSRLEPTVLQEPRLNLDRNDLTEPELLLEPRELNENVISKPTLLLEPELNVAEVNQARIKEIELHLSMLKDKLEKLEEAEVNTDSLMSPYLLAEQIKKSMVSLYKELCQLTDTEVTKRHEVRLQVVSGHPEGPVRCLEEFLNANIDKEGNPPFPDMHDVVQCVCDANERYNMFWSRHQILNEAHALFTQLGRSMQKRRQKREWKDLLGFVKQEAPDPADDDPQLQARLEENMRIARRNEDKLLDRFTRIEHGLIPHPDTELRVNMQSEDSDKNSDINTTTGTDNMNSIDTLISVEIPKLTVRSDLDSFKRIGQAFRCASTLTLSGGNIVIQPIEKISENPFQSASNAIGPKAMSNSENIFYPLKAHNVSIPSDKQTNLLLNDKFVNIDRTENIGPNSHLMKESSQSSCDNDFASAAEIAKKIMSLVQADVSAETAMAKEKPSDEPKSYLDAFKMFNPEVKLKKLVLNGFVSKNDRCFTIGTANSTSKSTISNESKQNGETVDNCQILTHTTRYKSFVINTESIENEASGKEIDNKIEKANSVVTKNVSTRVIIDDENLESMVKPEPLDIPSMLEELGQDFTATIFDIEDPFLVIEISDSSESEDDA